MEKRVNCDVWINGRHRRWYDVRPELLDRIEQLQKSKEKKHRAYRRMDLIIQRDR